MLANNQLTGTIPAAVSSMPRLAVGIEGRDECKYLTVLLILSTQTLDLSYNKFSGAINDFVSPVLATYVLPLPKEASINAGTGSTSQVIALVELLLPSLPPPQSRRLYYRTTPLRANFKLVILLHYKCSR